MTILQPRVRDDQVRRRTRQVLELDAKLAYLGDGNTPSNLYDPDIPGNVWVQEQTSNGRSTKISVRGPSDSNVPLIPGTPVYLLEDDEHQLYVARQAVSAQQAAGTNPMAERAQSNSTSVTQDDFATLGIIPGSSALTISIKAWNPIIDGIAYQFNGIADIDISSFVPVAGEMCYMVPFVTADYGYEIMSSTSRSTSDLPLDVDDIQECLDAASVGSVALRAIMLSDDQADLTYDQILAGIDLRQMVNTPEWAPAPATAASAGFKGQKAYDATHFYVCISTDTWVRCTLATW